MIPHSSCSVKFFYRRWKVTARKPIVCKPPIYTLYIIVFSHKDALIPQRKPFPTLPICTHLCFCHFPTHNRKMSFCNRSLCTNRFRVKKIDCFFHASIQIFHFYEKTIMRFAQKCKKVFDKYAIVKYHRLQIRNRSTTNQ